MDDMNRCVRDKHLEMSLSEEELSIIHDALLAWTADREVSIRLVQRISMAVRDLPL